MAVSKFKLALLLLLIFSSLGIFLFKGINLGLDFKGGTMFQIKLERPVNQEEMEKITNVIEQRLNWTGLKDVKVLSLSNEFVVVQMPITDQKEIETIEKLLRKQGKFEVRFEGETLFTGNDVISVDTLSSVVAFQEFNGSYIWNLPFTLSASAAERFRNAVFHKCTLVSAAIDQRQYNCKLTYFFIDRPENALLITTKALDVFDKALFSNGSTKYGIPENTNFEEVIENAGVSYYVVESDEIKNKDLNAIKKIVENENIEEIIVPSSLKNIELLENELRKLAKDIKIKIISVGNDESFFIKATGLRQIVRLQPSVTGNEPYVEKPEDAPLITDLIITGTETTLEEAERQRNETKALLLSGSLPVSIESISIETINPLLGPKFFEYMIIIGLLALLAVAFIIFLKYRKAKISAAIVFTALVEAFSTTAFTSLFGNIDLGALAGIIIAIGTGVDDQIIITDELLARHKELHLSLISRIKRAFFEIFAAAATTFAVMLAILFYGFAFIKLVGFAIATIIGITIGIFITRPFYAEIAKELLY